MNFLTAFEKLLKHEGGYVNHPADPGGETMWGVTKRVAVANGYTAAMRDMPQSVAQAIYKKLYWDAVQADQLPVGVRYAVFDAAVNSGVSQAVKWLQRAAGAADDGVVGPMTIKTVNALSAETVRRTFLAQRLRFMTDLPTWPAFGKGWTRRICDLMEM
jgi:lysozyme family protein